MDEKQTTEKTTAAASCGCSDADEMGRSEGMEHDRTTANDIVGASNYERAESDQSKGMFARQTQERNRVMDDINREEPPCPASAPMKDDEPRLYGNTEDSPDFPSEGTFSAPFSV